MSLDYACCVGSIGYEGRSTFVPRVMHGRRVPLLLAAFAENRELAFDAGLTFATGANASVFEPHDAQASSYSNWLFARLLDATSDGHSRLCIDVSSMTRSRVAETLEVLEFIAAERGHVYCDFTYAPARYKPPPEETETLIETVGPVSSSFAGWSPRIEVPTVVLFGLGYEHERAVGVSEYLDALDAWAFVPTGEEASYERDVRARNSLLWDLLGDARFVPYVVADPRDSLLRIEGLATRLRPSSRLVLIPFGPKLFALLCMLVARRSQSEIAVWRATAGSGTEPHVVIPSGKIVTFATSVDEAGNWQTEDGLGQVPRSEARAALAALG